MTTPPDTGFVVPSLAVRIRESWTPTWVSYGLSLPLSVFAILASTEPIGGGRWGERVAITTCCLAGGLVWVWLSLRVRRRWPRLSLPAIIGYLLASGAFLGLTVEAFERVFGLVEPTNPGVRIALTAVLLTWWFLTIGLIQDGRRRVLSYRTQLIDERVALLVTSEEHRELITALRRNIAADMHSRLQPAVQVIDARLRKQHDDITYDEGAEIAEVLLEAAQDTVKPVSRSIWESTQRTYAPPRLRGMVRRIVANSPFRPAIVALIYAAAALSGPEAGSTSDVIDIAITAVIVAAFLLAANALMRRAPQWHTPIFITAVVLLQSPTIAAIWIPSFAPSPNYTVVDALARVALGVIIIVITSGFGSWRRSHVQILESLQADLERDEVAAAARDRATVSILRELARYLHADVQSRLFTSANAIEQATAAKDFDALRAALRDARNALSQTVPDDSSPSVVDLDADLAQLQDLWRGLLRLDYTLPTQPWIDAPAARALVAIAEEAVANAARHGNATRVGIDISVQESPRAWLITVTDDGVGPTNGPRGLGSTVFQDVTAGDWMLTLGSNGGACLTATVPVSRESASLRQAD